MAKKRNRRQAATSRGLQKRLVDIDFNKVADPRKGPKYRLAGLLQLTVATLASSGNSQREIESRSEQIWDEGLGELFGLPDERVADNTVGTLFPRLVPDELRECLHRAVKAEHRRGTALVGEVGGRKVVSLDGKVLAPVRWHSLISAARQVLRKLEDERGSDPEWTPDVDELRRVLEAGGMDGVQLCTSAKGDVYGLVRMHRWTLVSGKAAVGIDERVIPGTSNEVGSAPESFKQLMATYKRTSIFNTVTADAGNTSLKFATRLHRQDLAYFLAVKSNNGDIYKEAESRLQNAHTAICSTEERCGATVAYSVFVAKTEHPWHRWNHAKQVIRVERVTTKDNGSTSVGNRYYVTSLDAAALSPHQALEVCRAHWRCENEGHWTADTIFKEDAHRAPLSRHPIGMLVGSLLRMLAQNILAVLRALSRGHGKRKPTWKQVQHYILAIAFRPSLDARKFEAFV